MRDTQLRIIYNGFLHFVEAHAKLDNYEEQRLQSLLLHHIVYIHMCFKCMLKYAFIMIEICIDCVYCHS